MFFLRQAINVSYINTTISIVNHVDENVFWCCFVAYQPFDIDRTDFSAEYSVYIKPQYTFKRWHYSF